MQLITLNTSATVNNTCHLRLVRFCIILGMTDLGVWCGILSYIPFLKLYFCVRLLRVRASSRLKNLFRRKVLAQRDIVPN